MFTSKVAVFVVKAPKQNLF